MERQIAFRDRVHYTVEALKNRFSACIVPEEIDGIVVSPGGVASTMIINHLSQFITVNDPANQDGLKHRSASPKEQPIGVPALLITGDPQEIVKSLSRRDYLPHQAIRLASMSFFLVPATMRRGRFNRALERQYRSWVGNYSHLLVIRYEEIWDRKEEIAQHFGIDDPMFLVNFPLKEKRKSL